MLYVERTSLISVGFVSFGRIILKICRISISCSNHDYSSCRFSSFCFWSGPVQMCIWRAFWITHVVVDILQSYCQVLYCQKEISSNHLPNAGPGIWFLLGNQDIVLVGDHGNRGQNLKDLSDKRLGKSELLDNGLHKKIHLSLSTSDTAYKRTFIKCVSTTYMQSTECFYLIDLLYHLTVVSQ